MLEFKNDHFDDLRELQSEDFLSSAAEKALVAFLEHAQGSLEDWLSKGNLEKALTEFGKRLFNAKLNRKIKPAGPVNIAVGKHIRSHLAKALADREAIKQQADELKRLPQVKTQSHLNRLNPRQFELWTAYYLKIMGYRKVTVTSYSGDFGVDVYAENRKGQKFVVQCKHYQGAVGTPVIQQTMGAVWFAKADICCVAVSGEFSRKALDLAKEYPDEIFLLDGARMVRDCREKMTPISTHPEVKTSTAAKQTTVAKTGGNRNGRNFKD